MKQIKKWSSEITGIQYRIIEATGGAGPFMLQYFSSGAWQYCGDYESCRDAEKYALKRDNYLIAGDSVML